jgi:hypothetical protein
MTIQDCYRSQLKQFGEGSFEIQAKMWQRQFAEISFAEVFNAFEIHWSDSKFAPLPADLKEIIKSNHNPQAFISSEIAWEKVIKKVRSFGRYQKDNGMRGLTEAEKRTANAIGWDRMCDCSNDDLGYLKRDFINLYSDINSEHRKAELIPEGVFQRLQKMKQQQLESNG